MKCGVGDYTELLVRYLATMDATVFLITSRDGTGLNTTDANNLFMHNIINDWGFRDLRLLIQTVLSLRPDIIHIQYPTLAYSGYKCMINIFPLFFRLFNRKIPILVTLHEFSNTSFLRKLTLIPFFLICEKIIVTTEYEKRSLLKTRLVSAERIQTIPLGSSIETVEADQSAKDTLRETLKIRKDSFIIGYFGYIYSAKNLELLFYAFKDALLKVPGKIHLLMIADQAPPPGLLSASDAIKKILSIIRYEKIEDDVTWTGYLPKRDVSLALGICDICVLPYSDGVSLRRTSFLTALAHGLPVVTNRGLGIDSALKHMQNVYLVPTHDSHGISDAILELYSSKNLRDRIGENARQFSKEFDWENIASRTWACYSELIGRAKI